MRNLLQLQIFFLCLCLGIVSAFATNETQVEEIKGKVIQVELEPSRDPLNPNLWPCLYRNEKPVMLVGTPDILEELTYLSGKDVELIAKKLPVQKFGDREYDCVEVTDINKVEDKVYLIFHRAMIEFKEVLLKNGFIDTSGKQLIDEGVLRSVWFDKNENGVVDFNDKLFVISRTTGKNDGSFVVYPSQVIVKMHGNEYETFVFKDPYPGVVDPTVMGVLKYKKERQNGRYFIEAEKILMVEGNIERIEPFVGERLLLVGQILKKDSGETIFRYDTILWHSKDNVEIRRVNGQYLVTVKGNISVAKMLLQEPWRLEVVLLESKDGQKFELRQKGYASFWNGFEGKELTVTGLLRPITYYEGKPTCVIEVTRVDVN